MSQHDLALAQEFMQRTSTFSPLLTAHVCITRHETSTLCIIYSTAMSLGNWFCMSRKGGTGGGGLVHPCREWKQPGHVWAGCENPSV